MIPYVEELNQPSPNEQKNSILPLIKKMAISKLNTGANINEPALSQGVTPANVKGREDAVQKLLFPSSPQPYSGEYGSWPLTLSLYITQ